jgi:macrolide transport system ATP-binding/permease protein
LHIIWQDLRYALRMLGKNPGFTAVAVITLALGIGLNTAIFSVVNAVLFMPLPVRAPEQLAGVYNTEPQEFITHVPMAYPDYRDLRDANHSFDGLIGYSLLPLALDRGDESERVFGEIVTGNYFTTLGVNAVLGRMLLPDDDRAPGAHPVTVLSYATWQRRFGSNPDIVGRRIHLNGNNFTVIGVAPREFHGLLRGIAPELWVPMMMHGTLRVQAAMNVEDGPSNVESLENRRRRWMWVIGRLKPGITLEQAQAEAQIVAQRMALQYPDTNRDRKIGLLHTNDVKILPGLGKVLYGTSFVLMGIVALVLLVASANVANMLLARATARRKEICVRLALGATRARIVKQLLTESLVLSLLGGGLGLLLAAWSNAALNAIQLPLPVQIALGLTLDYRVLGFTTFVATITAVLFGLAPALQATKRDLTVALKEESGATAGGRSKRRLQRSLVVAQLAVCLILLVFAGLSVRSMQNAHRIDPGFDSKGVVVGTFDPGSRGYTKPQVEEFYRALGERARALPGVESVALTTHLPLSFDITIEKVAPEGLDIGLDRTWPEADASSVGPGYFSTLRIPITRGREFSEQDRPKTPFVAIVNETMASKYWPRRDPIGQRVRFETKGPYYQVVGVARDGKYRTLGEEPRPFIYRALLQSFPNEPAMLIRAAGNPGALVGSLRQEARHLDEKVPVIELRTVNEAISVSLLLPRTGATLFGLFGVLGLVLASVGLYGVVAYMVSQRTREIGIRMALGARRVDILRLVLGQGLKLVLTGIALGLAGALALTRTLASILYGVSATDPATFAGVAVLLTGVALLAFSLPARRAVRVDPISALRYE